MISPRATSLFIALMALATAGAPSACQKSDDPSRLHVSGTIEAVSAEIGFRQGGRVARRLVSEGDAVKRAQLLAELDDAPFRTDVAQREADWQTAQAALLEVRHGARPEEIDAARAALDRASIQSSQLDDQAARAERLFLVGGLAAQERDALQANAGVAAASRREAAARLRQLMKGARPEDVAQARGHAQQAAAALNAARTRLADTRLLAPFSGLVLAHHVEVGEIVAAGTPIVTLGQLTDTYLEAYVPESDMPRVRPGQAATVTVDGLTRQRFAGRVTFISSEAEFTPKSVQTEKDRVKLVYRIKIDVPNPHFVLKPGMPADAAIAVSPAGR
jgi:HlyD family secretion protein